MTDQTAPKDLNTLLSEYRMCCEVLEMAPPSSFADTVNLASALNRTCADILPKLQNLSTNGFGLTRMHASALQDQLQATHPDVLARLEEIGVSHFAKDLPSPQRKMIRDSISLHGLTINLCQEPEEKTKTAQETIKALRKLATLYNETQRDQFFISVPDDGGSAVLVLQDIASQTRLTEAVQSASPSATFSTVQKKGPKGPMN